MDDTTLDRHRCHDPRCRRPYAVVYRRSLHDVPIPLAVACPSCGHWDVVMVPTGAVRDADGAYVLPLGYEAAALSA
jgi:hypothetical protein